MRPSRNGGPPQSNRSSGGNFAAEPASEITCSVGLWASSSPTNVPARMSTTNTTRSATNGNRVGSGFGSGGSSGGARVQRVGGDRGCGLGETEQLEVDVGGRIRFGRGHGFAFRRVREVRIGQPGRTLMRAASAEVGPPSARADVEIDIRRRVRFRHEDIVLFWRGRLGRSRCGDRATTGASARCNWCGRWRVGGWVQRVPVPIEPRVFGAG